VFGFQSSRWGCDAGLRADVLDFDGQVDTRRLGLFSILFSGNRKKPTPPDKQNNW
jgi:hypothetical protein